MRILDISQSVCVESAV